MNIREAEKEYPALDLYELARQIKGFLVRYSFVQSVHLYHGANKAKYHIIFKVPKVSESEEESPEIPTETKSNDERVKEFFRIDKSEEIPGEPETEAELYAEFYDNIIWPTCISLQLDEVYRRDKIGPKPLGPSPYDERPEKEWEWSIADGNDNILTGFYPVTSNLEYKGDASRNLGMRDLVQSGEPVLLYEWPNDKAGIPVPREQTHPEEFIRSLSIAYESDTEIKIKAGTRKSRTYSFAHLGFQREDTKAWRVLVGIVRDEDHSYPLGFAHGANRVRNKSYESKRSILREISKKFVSFLNKTYKLQLPDKFQIFELVKNGPSGVYRLKLVVSNFSTGEADYDALSKDELIKEIKKLSRLKYSLEIRGDEDSEDKLMQATNDLNAACVIAGKKNWLTRNRMRQYLKGSTEE